MENGSGVLRVCGKIVPDGDKWMYDWMEEPSLCPNDVHAALRECAGAPLALRINSPGGRIMEGAEIYTALWEYPGQVTCDIVGLAASEASVISTVSAKPGNRCRISPLGMVMVHNVQSATEGDYRAMETARDMLLAANATLVTAYVRRTGKTEDEVRALMDKETWYSPQEALATGLVDEIMLEGNTPLSKPLAALSAVYGENSGAAMLLRRLSALSSTGKPQPTPQTQPPDPDGQKEYDCAKAMLALEEIRFGGI